ncbi:PREDICTED: uncharacterized protein LOC106805445 [Priapulus caudatus]|uniref:Uncharacterized protein LOC106805445 n=1 Tax=Priapulus caudatus TaxID=37621 RepID=A0ABM1DRE0_PRICU|nr:PREDICTED: uncharacterized protein LOC106805445 [Priapulus caudatus]
MDMFSDFAVDLDKVLDDFELSEDQKTLPGKVKSSPLPKENCTDQNLLVALKTNQLAATGGNTSNSAVTSLRYDIYEEPCVARDTRCDGAGAVWQASANGSAGDRVHDDGAHSGREAAQCVSVASGKTCRGDRTGAVFDDLIPVKDNREVNGHAAAVTAVVANGDVCTPLALSHFIGDDSIGDVPADGQLNVNGLGGTGNLQSQHASGQHTPPEALGKRDLESASETSAKFLKGEQTVLNHGPTDCSVRAYAGTAGSDNECRTPVSATHILPIDTGTVVSCHDTIAATVAQVSFPRGCDSGYSTIEDGSEQSFALNATRAVSLEQAAVAVARDPAAEVIRSGDGGAKSTEQLQMPVIGFTSLVNDDDNVSDSELEAMLASSAPAAAQRAAAESRDAPASAAAGVDTRVTPPGLRSPVHHRHAGGQVAAETSRVDAAGGSGERARPRETAAAASAHGKPSYSQSGARPKHRWFKSDGGGTVLEKLVYEPLPGEPSRRERLASDATT